MHFSTTYFTALHKFLRLLLPWTLETKHQKMCGNGFIWLREVDIKAANVNDIYLLLSPRNVPEQARDYIYKGTISLITEIHFTSVSSLCFVMLPLIALMDK